MANRATGFLTLAISAAMTLSAIGPDPVVAAETGAPMVLAQAERQGGIFRFLRKREPGRRVIVIEPPPQSAARPRQAQPKKAAPSQQRQTKAKARAKKRTAARKAPARAAAKAKAAPVAAAVAKAPDAAKILVVGDFMAVALAKGLNEAYAENPNIVVVDANNGSSGLVREDHYNWPEELKGIVEEHDPAAIVVLVGANDRQAISTASGPRAFGSDGWSPAFSARVGAFADALKATGKPALWGSLVPVRPAAMSRDYSGMNGAIRDVLDGSGIVFVDLWNGFADEEGRFVASGPDFRGQNSQLRASDGINFTRSGQRKLAFFVQQSLDDILKTGAPEQVASINPAGAAMLPLPAKPDEPQIGPMVPIESVRSTGGPLSSATPADRGGVAAIVVERLNGGSGSVPASRADSFSGWPVY